MNPPHDERQRFPGPRRYPVAWALGATFWLLHGVGLALANHAGNLGRVSWARVAVWAAVDVGTWVLVTLAVLVLAVRVPLRRGRDRVVLAAGAAVLACLRLAFVWVILQSLAQETPPLAYLVIFVPSNLSLTGGLFAMGYAVRGYYARLESERRARALDAEFADAELRVLETQLQPALLFDALRSLSALMRRNVAAADAMLAELGGLLRASLQRTGPSLVPLREETERVRALLAVAEIRHGGLQVGFELEGARGEFPVPQGILQPLVEHALDEAAADGRPAELRIAAREREGTLELEVRGRVSWPSAAGPEPPRLWPAAVRARLLHLYGGAASLELSSRTGGGTRCILRIPERATPAPAPDAAPRADSLRMPPEGPAEPVGTRMWNGIREAGPRYVAAWVLAAAAELLALAATNALGFTDVSTRSALRGALHSSFLWMLVAFPCLVVALAFPVRRPRILLTAGVNVLAAAAALLAYAAIERGVGRTPPGLWAALAATSTFGMAAVAAVQGYGHLVAYAHAFRAAEGRAAELRRQLSQAELRTLQMQLQPHFLFNALNSVSALLRRDVDRADAMLSELGALLRMSLQRSTRPMVTLREELELVRRYLGIEQVRYQDRLRVRFALQDATQYVPVPHLILQPLVENAVKHGIAPHGEPAELLVAARMTAEGGLELEVRDGGVGLDPDHATPRRESTGLGLSATRARLKQLYGDGAALELTSPPGGGTRALLRLPAFATTSA